MAEVIRIAESPAEATPATLPQNVEAEAALLGALMIDNRLVEDVQLKLQPASFLRAAARPHLRAILAHDRRQPGRQSGHLAAAVRQRRGDEAARRPGLSRPADRIGRGDHRRTRLRRADLRPRAAPGADRRRPRDWSKARSTPARRSIRSQQIEKAETALYKVAEEGGSAEQGQDASPKPPSDALEMAERALNIGRPSVGLHHRPRQRSTPRSAACTSPT